jgi:hypothetical protein
MGSQIAEFKSLWEAEAGKTRLGKQQQKAAEAEHKAAQADLAAQLRHAASVIQQLDSNQTELMTQVCTHAHILFFVSLPHCFLAPHSHPS